jgi:hypothetical protein
VALVAPPPLVARPVGAELSERLKIVEHPGAAAAHHLDSLLGHRRRSETRVLDRRHRAVSVLNRDRRALGRVDARGRRRRSRKDALRRAAQPVGEVEEMTRFAEDPATALERVIEPVLGRERRVHAVDELDRAGPLAHLVRELARQGREWTVEADREPVVLVPGLPDVVDLLARQAERLLDEDRLAGPQRRGRDFGVGVVPRPDDDEVDVGRVYGFAPVRRAAGAVE